MIVCLNCGADNEPGTVFCDACGAKLGVAPVITEDAPAEVPPREPESPEAIQPDEPIYDGPEEEPDDEPPPPPPVDPTWPVCRRCGHVNFPDRHFCSQCAEPLAEPVAPPRERWWRRLLRWRAARAKRGRRPRRGPSFGALFRRTLLLALLVAAIAAALGFRGQLRETAGDAYRAVRDQVERVLNRDDAAQATASVSARSTLSYSSCARAAAARSPACR